MTDAKQKARRVDPIIVLAFPARFYCPNDGTELLKLRGRLGKFYVCPEPVRCGYIFDARVARRLAAKIAEAERSRVEV